MGPKISTDVDGDVTDQTKGYTTMPASLNRPNTVRINEDTFERVPGTPSENSENSTGDDNPSTTKLNSGDMSERGNNQRAY